jgi:translation initiation factor 3 subunit A
LGADSGKQLVLKKFIELAVEKVTAAQQKADEVQSSIDATATASVDDLEASETPESILLATVSGEQSRDRTDRAIVTPWLKFLWEAYRTVLDILRNNARLEILYQSTAMQAFDFCLKYTRKTEFRRLCELLRNHVQTAAKYSSQMHAINLSDPDTLQRHLETRFQQLNVAVELELWQEAFRSVEDIHTLLNLSKRPPKNIMMANYYEKLTRIFLVGENYLFHGRGTTPSSASPLPLWLLGRARSLTTLLHLMPISRGPLPSCSCRLSPSLSSARPDLAVLWWISTRPGRTRTPA